MRFWVAGLLVCLSSVVAAEPMETALADIVKNSTTVVIAKYKKPADPQNATSYELTVERALKGTPAKGALVVKPQPYGHPHMADGSRVVAFVDAKGTWLAFAKPVAGPSIEDGVLEIEGFYDTNAHMIAPGFVTLEQLESHVGKGLPLAWTFHGRIVTSAKASVGASKIVLDVTYPAGDVKGLPGNFGKPTVYLGSYKHRQLELTWRAPDGRRFELLGTFTAKNLDGSIGVVFDIVDPGLVDEKSLRTYLTGGKVGAAYHEFAVTVGRRTERLTLGSSSSAQDRLGTREIRTSSSGDPVVLQTPTVKLSITPKKRDLLTRRGRGVVIEAAISASACAWEETGTSTPCTIRYLGVKTARLATP